MSISWQWAKANPDAAARQIRELQRENAELQKIIATMKERLIWLELEQWYVVDKKETKP